MDSVQTRQRRKTFQEKLRPTPAQAAALEVVLWRCHMLYNTALAQRLTLAASGSVSVCR